MKKLFTLVLSVAAFTLSAQNITNVNIGTDLNSTAWGKVNNNNNTFTAWYNALVLTNAWLGGDLTANTTAINVVSNNLATVTNALGAFLATGEARFDAGKITSDGSGNLNLTAASPNGNLFFQNNSSAQYYFGPDPANPGVAGTAYSIADGLSVHMDVVATSSGYAQLTCRQGNNGTPYSGIYCDVSGDANLADDVDGSLMNLNAGGAIDLQDASGTGLHFNGSGQASFDGGVTFLGGGAAIVSDSYGNGGTTLMLNASDTGSPMYLHVDSGGSITVSSSP